MTVSRDNAGVFVFEDLNSFEECLLVRYFVAWSVIGVFV